MIESLGDIPIDENEKKPFGGINPYSPYFDSIGNQFFNFFVEYGKLNRTSKVLDVGCGTGRIAKQLEKFSESYIGFDVNSRFIDYCKRTYQLQFDLVDVHHDEYNKTGSIDPNKFTFPYQDGQFDFVCAIAVFNHFRPQWTERYIEEISRVLSTNGVFFCTIVLLNQRSIKFSENKKEHPFCFKHITPGARYEYENRPLWNVAFYEHQIRRTLIKYKLMISEPIRYGEWAGSKIAITGHDVLIANKI